MLSLLLLALALTSLAQEQAPSEALAASLEKDALKLDTEAYLLEVEAQRLANLAASVRGEANQQTVELSQNWGGGGPAVGGPAVGGPAVGGAPKAGSGPNWGAAKGSGPKAGSGPQAGNGPWGAANPQPGSGPWGAAKATKGGSGPKAGNWVGSGPQQAASGPKASGPKGGNWATNGPIYTTNADVNAQSLQNADPLGCPKPSTAAPQQILAKGSKKGTDVPQVLAKGGKKGETTAPQKAADASLLTVEQPAANGQVDALGCPRPPAPQPTGQPSLFAKGGETKGPIGGGKKNGDPVATSSPVTTAAASPALFAKSGPKGKKNGDPVATSAPVTTSAINPALLSKSDPKSGSKGPIGGGKQNDPLVTISPVATTNPVTTSGLNPSLLAKSDNKGTKSPNGGGKKGGGVTDPIATGAPATTQAVVDTQDYDYVNNAILNDYQQQLLRATNSPNWGKKQN